MNYFWEKAKWAMAHRKPIVEVEDKLPPLPTVQNRKKIKKKKDIQDYDFRDVGGHVEVYKDGKFQYSADTAQEARLIFRTEDF